MVNVVVLMGILLHCDEQNKAIRYLEVIEEFKNNRGELIRDIVPLINWNKIHQGDLFVYQNGATVLVKGRLEIIDDKMYVICENLTYLGKKE